jgi:23S rRNA pseudouridine1911/1915/1917 synthase
MKRGPAHPTDHLTARLRALFPEAPGRRLKQWLAAGRVRVDGAVARDGRAAVRAGATVALGPPATVPARAALDIVLEDDQVVVVDKPSGLLTIATETERARTLYRLVWDHLATRRPPRRPFIVHRLDRETSGLVVLATSVEAKRALQAQFEARTVERVYVAVVEGRVRDDEGVLRSELVEDRSLRVRETRRGGAPRGAGRAREAITRYRVLARAGDRTWLELTLGTGRRRQIRVQLAGLGHPVVGDAEHGARAAKRLLLHATRLAFAHPATGAAVRVESPPPGAIRPPGRTPP